MIFVWMGFLKPDAGPIPQSVQQQTTDFLSPALHQYPHVGQLLDKSRQARRDDDDLRGPDRHAAETFVEGSPYLQAGLYEQHTCTNISTRSVSSN